MPLPVQADLLRFAQTRRFRRLGANAEQHADVRIVAAAQPDLKDRIGKGLFRSDLYYRVAEVEVETPSLRTIPSDVSQVVRYLVFRLANRAGGPGQLRMHLAYFESGRDVLAGQHWPGNVRQLAALVKRRVLLGDDVLAELGGVVRTAPATPAAAGATPAPIRPIDDVVGEHVRCVFANRGHLTQREVAAGLGCSINTLKKRLRG